MCLKKNPTKQKKIDPGTSKISAAVYFLWQPAVAEVHARQTDPLLCFSRIVNFAGYQIDPVYLTYHPKPPRVQKLLVLGALKKKTTKKPARSFFFLKGNSTDSFFTAVAVLLKVLWTRTKKYLPLKKKHG